MNLKFYIQKTGGGLRIVNYSPISLVEFGTSQLVILCNEELNAPVFNWVSPTGRKFEERGLYRKVELDEFGYYAYIGTIFPVMTVGPAPTSFSAVSFRDGVLVSPIARIPVESTIYPEQVEICPTAIDAINSAISAVSGVATANGIAIEALELNKLNISTQTGNLIDAIWIGDSSDFEALTEQEGTAYFVLED